MAAKNLLQSLDTSVDPCNDFYTFACGGWMKHHPVPATESHRHQFDLVSERVNKQVKDILEESCTDHDLIPVQAAKDSYKACMDLEEIELVGLQPLVDLSNELGGWPIALDYWDDENYSPQKVVGELKRLMGLSALFSTYVHLDRKNSSRNVLIVDQPSFYLPRSMLVDRDTYGKQLEAYKHWIAQTAYEVMLHMSNAISFKDIIEEAGQIVEFEIALAKITSREEMRRNEFRSYNAMTVKTLQEWTDSAQADNPYAQFEWLSFFNHILYDVDVTIDEDERVVIKEVDYLFELVTLLDNTPQRVVANYLQWLLFKSMADETSKRMREISFSFDKVFSGIEEKPPRWQDCVTKISDWLSHAIGYKYVQSYFNVQSKTAALNMVENIRSSFYKRLLEVTWMDKATNLLAKEKADSMSEFIGYPDWYSNASALLEFYKQVNVSQQEHFYNIMNFRTVEVRRGLSKLRLPADRKEWITSPDVVNAFYDPLSNSISFPAGILQPPFFNVGRPESLNYGGIGVVIGHEITHGFDDMGRQSDKSGNLVQWWTKATLDTYLEKAQCLIDQYNNYRVPELDEMLKSEVRMNGIITQGENIADNGGLNTAYQAYRQYVEQNGPEPRLPGLEMYTPDHLFFVGFANVWCETTTKERLLSDVLTDEHSPSKLRVRGSVSNSEDFARVFDCPRGSNMNPEKKCLIW